jgi:hypothetical protein
MEKRCGQQKRRVNDPQDSAQLIVRCVAAKLSIKYVVTSKYRIVVTNLVIRYLVISVKVVITKACY